MQTRIKQLESFRDFKQELKLFLLDHHPYSLNDFLCLKKITEPLINNTSKTRCDEDFYFILIVAIV